MEVAERAARFKAGGQGGEHALRAEMIRSGGF